MAKDIITKTRKVTGRTAKIAAVKALILKIELALDVNDEIISAPQSYEDPCPAMIARRSEILADIAMGVDRQADLTELDKATGLEQISAAAFKQACGVATAKQTHDGLQAKLNAAYKDLAAL